MKKYLSYIFLAIVIAALLGCATTPASRRKELMSQYPNWPQDTIIKVSKGVVEVGMTKEQAREALKAPQRYDLQLEGDRWTYVDDIVEDREIKQQYGKVLIFEGDRIVRIRNFIRIPDLMINIEW